MRVRATKKLQLLTSDRPTERKVMVNGLPKQSRKIYNPRVHTTGCII